MTPAETLYTQLTDYYGEPDSRAVVEAVRDELAKLSPLAYDAIYRTVTRQRPRKYGPIDVEGIHAAAEALRKDGFAVDVRPQRDPCPVCGAIPTGSSRVCLNCGMELADAHDQAKVSEHAEWWAAWKAGKVPRFSLSEGLARLAAEREEEERKKLEQEGNSVATRAAAASGAKASAQVLQRMGMEGKR